MLGQRRSVLGNGPTLYQNHTSDDMVDSELFNVGPPSVMLAQPWSVSIRTALKK